MNNVPEQTPSAPRQECIDRFRLALSAFQAAQKAFLTAHRDAKSMAPAQDQSFWRTHGAALEARQRAASTAVITAFQAFSAAGLVADVQDRHLVTEARRYLAEGQ